MTITDIIMTPAERFQQAREQWAEDAIATITDLVAEKPYGVFTTKDFWAVLNDTPGDRRGPMRRVMSRLTKSGVVKPAGFAPDPGEAETKDGKVFAFNKPVVRYVAMPVEGAK